MGSKAIMRTTATTTKAPLLPKKHVNGKEKVCVRLSVRCAIELCLAFVVFDGNVFVNNECPLL